VCSSDLPGELAGLPADIVLIARRPALEAEIRAYAITVPDVEHELIILEEMRAGDADLEAQFTQWLTRLGIEPDVEDAARLEGAGEWKVFFKICVPQLKAGLAATSVFAIILTWNEFLFALLLTGVETRTVPVAMARTLGGEVGVDYGLLAAIVTLFLIPIFFVTFMLQNQLLRGVTFGTVKK